MRAYGKWRQSIACRRLPLPFMQQRDQADDTDPTPDTYEPRVTRPRSPKILKQGGERGYEICGSPCFPLLSTPRFLRILARRTEERSARNLERRETPIFEKSYHSFAHSLLLFLKRKRALRSAPFVFSLFAQSKDAFHTPPSAAEQPT